MNFVSNTITGTYDALTHPVQTAKSIGFLYNALDTSVPMNMEKMQLYSSIGQGFNNFMNSDPNTKVTMGTEFALNVGTLVAPYVPRGIDKLKGLSYVDDIANVAKISEASEVYSGISKGSVLGETFGEMDLQLFAKETGNVGESYFFRGTTEGYPGNPGLQRIGVTPTSLDPLISTVFATESEAFGNGVIHIASTSDLKGVNILDGNVLAGLEKEIGIELAPAEFAQKSSMTITAKDARAILKDMGYSMPEKIYGKEQLNSILKNTPRLTNEEINTFINKAKNIGGNK